MSFPNIRYADGWFGNEKELTVIPKPQFPFARNPISDTYSRVYDREYQVAPRLFLPKINRRTAATNLLTYSEDFTQSGWTNTNLTPTAAAGTAPDGNATLNKMLETVTNGEHSAMHAATVTASAQELFCFTVGGLGRDWVRLAFIDSAAVTFSAFFNVTSGYSISPSAGVTALVVPLGNGQTQCILRFTPAAGAGTWKANVSTDGATISYAGDVTKGVYLWGAQVAAGVQVPYISTTSATRAVSAPDRDKTDPMAYLVDEADPNILNSEAATVSRTFARIPLEQDVPTSLSVAKPALSGTFPQNSGSYVVVQPDATLPSFDAYERKTVTTDSGAPTSFYPTGGTYTLSLSGTAISATAYNASNSTLQTNLNAITPVSNRGNCVVTGNYNVAGGFVVTFNSYASLTIDVSSLTGGNIAYAVASGSGGYSQGVNIAAANPDLSASSVAVSGSWSPATPNVVTQIAGNNFAPVSIAIQYIMYSASGASPTGGTYTLTALGQTTGALNYNDSASTVLAAVNAALTNLTAKGTVTATVNPSFSYNGFAAIAVIINLVPVMTGGTFTATIFGQTTSAIAYNASVSTIQSALNALTEVSTKRGSCVVTGAGFASGFISFTVAFSNALIVASPASLTPAGANMSVTSADGGINRVQNVTFGTTTSSRTFVVAGGHNVTLSDTIMISTGAAVYSGIVGVFTIPDANTLTLTVAPTSPYAAAATITSLGRRTKIGYTSGTTVIRATNRTLFFLPGVSAGITTAANIPIASNQSDQTAFLNAVFAGSGTINYVVGQISQWMGPILQQTTTSISAADV